MDRRFPWIPLVLVAVLLVPARAALADFPSPAVYLGVYGGGNFRLKDWDLGTGLERTSQSSQPGRATGEAGLRLGVHVLPQLALEAEVGCIPVKYRGEYNSLLAYDLNLLFHILKGNWSPVLEAGFGGQTSLHGNLALDTDPRAHFGVGVRGLVLPWLAIRLDLRDVISDGWEKGEGNNLELLAGLDFFLWGTKKAVPAPADRDKDGIPDADDACPDAAGPTATQGCPDRDGDGVADARDACPDVAGQPERKGCPDRDGDGVADGEDACPDAAGPAKLKGCPDKDGDGIADRDDRCPDAAGPAKFKGCPDRDGDGVPDADDKCPDQRGLKEHDGCLPAKAAAFTGKIKGINFATGKSTILSSSFKVLDQAVAVLKEFPSLRLRIEGHTDNVGKPEANQVLSEARAKAVLDYLVKKGIASERLQSQGFGQTRPIADNATSAGRAENRRTEFSVLGQE